ncbi:AMP-binding protein [Corynebacterium sanguinis]|uniref:AMP-binding protein n=1 Tax=Corynebacterium sanguinis TaxID=2594913 RepID=UPI0010AA3B2C|nr:AMP-binding protein [Corynebacterium sanguinis]MCT1613165.1 AMP-binding protein [Corynebacterium sanguinis]MCT1695539.1 AMP-binding protein [Corynebacterium sanguinis]MCT1714947.1 AMP-binding protein [Corynebacterium sanguinis]MCT1805467.1 AMP-binding protein [Corynebacterium sanguinis]MCT2158440.1 AMP-binding protein [Corynebacterium sanguinis]
MTTETSTPTFETTAWGSIAVDENGRKLSWVRGQTIEQGAPPLLTQTLGQMLREVVERHPQRDCIVDVYADVSFTYERFYNRVLRLASAFIRHGLRKGDRVAIWSTNRWEWIIVQWACHLVGLILVNINPAYRQSELNYVLEKSGTKVVFAAPRFKDSDYRSMLNEARKQRGVNVEHVIYFGSADWFDAMHGEIDDLSAHTSELDADDAINIQFTSGTTGFPKGATLTHKNILNNGFFVAEHQNITHEDRVVVPVPFFHCFGMVMGTIGAFSHGATVIIPSPSFKARETLKAAQVSKATSLYGVPTMFIQELEEAHDHDEFGSPYKLDSLRTGVMAGTSCPSKTMRDVMTKFGMTEVTICYGMTETSPVSFQTRADSPEDKRVNTVGLIQPHLECKLVDASSDAPVGVGTQGEIWVRGYSVMKGYWEHEEKTAEAITEDGWMRTGDLGTFDEQGYLSVTGRLKDMVIRGGENIYPREIEEFLFTHPDIVDAQVIGVPDEKYGEETMAWIILRDGADPITAEDIAEFAQGKLSRHKVPRYVHTVTSYPMTVSGKVRKIELREMAPRVLGWV